MSKFRNLAVVAAVVMSAGIAPALAQDVGAGKKLFKKCVACHAVGPDARNKVGPQLNDLFGRSAGSIEKFKYSKAMKAAAEKGLVWTDDTVAELITKPRKFIKGTKMAFGGLKKEKDRNNIIAYLKTFSTGSETADAAKTKTDDQPEKAATTVTAAPSSRNLPIPQHGVFHLGRKALPEEVNAWDIDIRADGAGLPPGRGTVADGEPLFAENCASCHGDFGEGVDRWPVLAGGHDTLKEDRPVKTIGSYWPYLSTVFDYVRRAMPFGDARSLSDDDVYALTAYLLYVNDIVTDEEFELSRDNFSDIRLPNEANFTADTRKDEPHYAKNSEACMSDCKPGPVKVIMRARVLDVTPEGDDGEGAGPVD